MKSRDKAPRRGRECKSCPNTLRYSLTRLIMDRCRVSSMRWTPRSVSCENTYRTMDFKVNMTKPKMKMPRMDGINPYRLTNQPPRGVKACEQTAKIMIQVQM